MTTYAKNSVFVLLILLTHAEMPARANLFTLSASGTISSNSSSDSTIPIGTPWTFEITYNTAAPDLDFELTGSPDPTFGKFTNSSAPPALTFFHYQAGSYEVTIDDPADFGTFSDILITFTSVNAIDIKIDASTICPPLAGGAVSFHADFNAFSTAPIFASDGLPTNTGLSVGSFDQSTVTLLPPAGAISSSPTSLTLSVAAVLGDFDADGDVDGRDFLAWQRGDSPDPLSADDLADWQANFGMGSLVASNVAVPEPSTWVLLLLAAGGKFIRPRRFAQ